jgi:hypothetical protein
VEHAEFVAPRVAHYPEVEAAFFLVVPALSAEFFQALDLGSHVVGFQVQVHALLRGLLVAGLLEENSYLGVRQPQSTVDGAAVFRQWFFGGAERGGPERDAPVEV